MFLSWQRMSPCDVESVPTRPKPRILSENAAKPKAVILDFEHRQSVSVVGRADPVTPVFDTELPRGGILIPTVYPAKIGPLAGSEFAVSARMLKRTFPLLTSLLFAFATGCASETDTDVDDPSEESSAALCAPGPSKNVGSYEGIPKYSNGCQTWQTKCVSRSMYKRNLTLNIRTGGTNVGSWYRIGSCT